MIVVGTYVRKVMVDASRTTANGSGKRAWPTRGSARRPFERKGRGQGRRERRSFRDPRSENIGRASEKVSCKIQREPFHQQLVLGEDRVAGVARFAVARSTPDRSDAVMRQATVMDSASDEEAKSFLVHSRPRGCRAAVQRQIHRGPDARRRRPVRPWCRRMEGSTDG
jgi:hypothetical protein